MGFTPTTRSLAGSALAVLLMGTAFFSTLRFLDRATALADRRGQLNMALQALEQVLSDLKDAETGQRGYLLTQDPSYLEPYRRGESQAAAALDALRNLPGSRGLPEAQLEQLRGLTGTKLDELARTLRLSETGQRKEALALVSSGAGKLVMDQIRDLDASLSGNLLRQRDAGEIKLATERLRLRRALLVMGLLALSTLAGGAWTLHRGNQLRLAAEGSLAASERRFRALAESAPVGIYEFDFDRKTVYANGEHCRLTGVPREEVSRERLRAAVHPEDRPWVIARVEADMRDGLTFDQSYRLLHPDGTVVWVHSRGIPMEDPPGHAAGYLIASQNITAMRAAETEILTKAEALEAANKELEAFAYSVSHDLRAPLRHIDGFVGLLRQSLGAEIGGRAKHQLEVISASARQMGTLIDDLLTFSRMGRAEVHKTDFDLGALVRRIVDELAPDTAGRDITWRVGPLPSVHGDPSLLRLALLNLMGNAAKFTRGRPAALIEISARLDLSATTVTIRDNGAGFDMRYADKLFGVFQRLHRQEEFEGTGIGLANVARIIHKHGGTVSAEGALGEGASFTFTLPAAKELP